MELAVFWWPVAFVRRPLLWHGAKTVGPEAQPTGLNILTDMADPNAKLSDVVRRNVRNSAHRVLKRLSW